jgi:cellulose synthase/poly-beta-1,6-N-acetylglucosamine synthase-like glycosyltransferase
MEILFWAAVVIVLYAYVGYGIIITFFVKLFRRNKPAYKWDEGKAPFVSLIVPCFNEGPQLLDKVQNTLELYYPEGKMELIFICDGTSDGSEKIPMNFPQIKTMHSPERKGKLAAMKRAVKESSGEILVFCDANTVLNPEAIQRMMLPYVNPKVGAVTGEKYILEDDESGASTAGEGLYWKYESYLKKMDSEWNTLVGGAGELMSYRKELFQFLPDDTILDDFMLTMSIAEKGYQVKYVPDARASEYASANVGEEMKRKIRIAAGGWQSIARLPKAINPLHDFNLTFQYVSHRVLRWVVAPFCLAIIFVVNHYLVFTNPAPMYKWVLVGQYAFYMLALGGHFLQGRSVSIKGFFVPYYFYIMNYCALLGFGRFMRNSQASTWERAKRANEA